jgi:hypothetical protein
LTRKWGTLRQSNLAGDLRSDATDAAGVRPGGRKKAHR